MELKDNYFTTYNVIKPNKSEEVKQKIDIK